MNHGQICFVTAKLVPQKKRLYCEDPLHAEFSTVLLGAHPPGSQESIFLLETEADRGFHQAHVLYEEPGERGVMSLNEDGGAVFLTQPDGTTQLVLLTPDQRNQVSEVQALRQTAHDFKEPDTYRVGPLASAVST